LSRSRLAISAPGGCGPGDRLSVFLFGFDENVISASRPFSDNVPMAASRRAKDSAGRGTSIYDAVLLGAKGAQRRRRNSGGASSFSGKRCLETTSDSDFEARGKKLVAWTRALYDCDSRPVKNESGRTQAGEHSLVTIHGTTGGDMFFPSLLVSGTLR